MHTDGIRLYKGNYDRYLASKNNQPRPQTQQPEKPAKTSSYRGKAAKRGGGPPAGVLGAEIDQLAEEMARLEGEIASPEVAADYLLLQQTCDVLEEKQQAYDDALSRWSLLLEET